MVILFLHYQKKKLYKKCIILSNIKYKKYTYFYFFNIKYKYINYNYIHIQIIISHAIR